MQSTEQTLLKRLVPSQGGRFAVLSGPADAMICTGAASQRAGKLADHQGREKHSPVSRCRQPRLF